jgi:hypothetical protein
MRWTHSSITPTTVRLFTRQLLQTVLPWQPFGAKATVAKLLDLLLLVAALRRSLYAVARWFTFGFSHETARQAVHANLPALDVLTDQLACALHFFHSRDGRRFRKRAWTLAIDTHYCPFYGDRQTTGIVGGQKKQGTKYFYGYATAVLVHRRRRYTVGLLALDPSCKPHDLVERLLKQCQDNGLRVSGVVLDSGFDAGEVLLLLQGLGLSYAVPLQRKGKGSNRRNARFDDPIGSVAEVSWTTEKSRRAVSTSSVVVHRAGQKETKVYAFGGWTAEAARAAVSQAAVAQAAYRARFGIETSYRQLNETKGRTTAKDVVYRLLLVGVALLLRQVWVFLTELIGRIRGYEAAAWVAELPLQTLRSFLEAGLRQDYNERREIDLRRLPSACKLVRAA